MDRKELLNFIYKLIEEIKDQQVLKTLITRDEIAMLLSFYHELVNNTPLNEQKEGKEETLDKSNKINQESIAEANFGKYETNEPIYESYINTIGNSLIVLKNTKSRDTKIKMVKNIEIATCGLNLLEGMYEEEN